MFYDIVKRLIQIVDPLINEETATLTDKSFKAETILGLVIDPIIVDGYASLKILTSGLGLDDMSLAWPPWFNY